MFAVACIWDGVLPGARKESKDCFWLLRVVSPHPTWTCLNASSRCGLPVHKRNGLLRQAALGCQPEPHETNSFATACPGAASPQAERTFSAHMASAVASPHPIWTCLRASSHCGLHPFWTCPNASSHCELPARRRNKLFRRMSGQPAPHTDLSECIKPLRDASPHPHIHCGLPARRRNKLFRRMSGQPAPNTDLSECIRPLRDASPHPHIHCGLAARKRNELFRHITPCGLPARKRNELFRHITPCGLPARRRNELFRHITPCGLPARRRK